MYGIALMCPFDPCLFNVYASPDSLADRAFELAKQAKSLQEHSHKRHADKGVQAAVGSGSQPAYSESAVLWDCNPDMHLFIFLGVMGPTVIDNAGPGLRFVLGISHNNEL